MNSRQARSFAPILSALLSNLLISLVSAEYEPILPVKIAYDASPWLAYNKPKPSHYDHTYYHEDHSNDHHHHHGYHDHNHHDHHDHHDHEDHQQHHEWYPVENSKTDRNNQNSNNGVGDHKDYQHIQQYHVNYQDHLIRQKLQNHRNYHNFQNHQNPHSVLTTAIPEEYSTEKFMVDLQPPPFQQHQFPLYANLNQNQNNQDTLIGGASTLIDSTVPSPKNIETKSIESNNIETRNIEKLTPAASSVNQRKRQSQHHYKNRKGYTCKHQSRRRPTTPEYYDSYEDYSFVRRPNKNRRRPTKGDSEESYDDSSDYYDSFESTTKYNKPRRQPSKNKIKNNKRRNRITTEGPVYDDDFEGPQTEIVIVRQVQSTTTTEPPTLITSGTTTTTGSSTTVTTTTAASTTDSNNTTHNAGYGPPNGNEGISITYGPPYHHHYAPYIDWYNA